MSSASFWDAKADQYFEQPIKFPKLYEKKLALTQTYLRPEDRVFEFGCGTGGTALHHAGQVKDIVATDISERMIEIAWREAQKSGVSNVQFEAVSIEDYVPDAPFDMVLGLNILHLVKHRKAAIAKAYAMLKPGGHFATSTVCLSDRMGWLRLVIPFMQLVGAAPYVAFLKESDVIAELEAAGFEIVERYRPGKAIAPFLIARKPSA
jgi:2-polyprenyl-3-methyl-5-hydroxy-6-metoxy-1,4-benzoquinol methylase